MCVYTYVYVCLYTYVCVYVYTCIVHMMHVVFRHHSRNRTIHASVRRCFTHMQYMRIRTVCNANHASSKSRAHATYQYDRQTGRVCFARFL